jgi:fucose 4-O-acetylase-like acetyltransferase
MNRVRNPFVDNVKLVLIVLVVVGHALEPLVDASRGMKAVYVAIYAFHMPLFAAVSGALAKTERKPGRVRGLMWRLLAPFVIFQFLTFLLDVRDGVIEVNPLTIPHWPLWSLVALFVWSIALPFVARRRGALPLSIAAALLIGTIDQIGPPFSIARIIGFFPFFLGGHILGTSGLSALSRRLKTSSAITILCAVTALSFSFSAQINHAWLYGVDGYATLGVSALVGVFTRAGVMMLACILSLAVIALVPRGRTRVSALAKKTLYAYLLHGFGLRVAKLVGIYDVASPEILGVTLVVVAAVGALVLMTEPVARIARPLVEPASVFRKRHASDGMSVKAAASVAP